MKTKNRVKYQRNIFTEEQKHKIIHYFTTLEDNRINVIADLMETTNSRVAKIINDYLDGKYKIMKKNIKLEEQNNDDK